MHLTKLPQNLGDFIKQDTALVRIDGGGVVLPARLWHILEKHAIRLDYDYQDGEKLWKFHKTQDVPVTYMHANDLLAMKVAERLEK